MHLYFIVQCIKYQRATKKEEKVNDYLKKKYNSLYIITALKHFEQYYRYVRFFFISSLLLLFSFYYFLLKVELFVSDVLISKFAPDSNLLIRLNLKTGRWQQSFVESSKIEAL